MVFSQTVQSFSSTLNRLSLVSGEEKQITKARIPQPYNTPVCYLLKKTVILLNISNLITNQLEIGYSFRFGISLGLVCGIENLLVLDQI